MVVVYIQVMSSYMTLDPEELGGPVLCARTLCISVFQRCIWVSYMTVVSDSHAQSNLDAVYVYVVPWSEFPIPSPALRIGAIHSSRCRANMAQIRRLRPDYGLGIEVKVPKIF